MISNKHNIIILLILGSFLSYGQNKNTVEKSNGLLLSRFGYTISFYSLSKYDSNVLRLSSGTSDFSSSIYPSLTVSYPFSTSTKVTAQYLFGLEKYISTSILNTNYNSAELKIEHYFSPSWFGQIYGYYLHSNQPDVLTSSSSIYKFETFGQIAGTVKLNWLKSNQSLFALEYTIIQRDYAHLLTLSLTKQKDYQNIIALSWAHQLSAYTFSNIKFGFITNSSNNYNYIYNRQFLDAYITHNIVNGFYLQIEDVIGNLNFNSRKIRPDSTKTRQDVLNMTIIGVKKNITDYLSLRLSYNLIKDFSNDNNRNFLSNSIHLGLQITFGKNSEYQERTDIDQSSLQNSINLDKEILTADQYTNIGYQYILKGNYSKALEYSIKALRLDDNIQQAHINAGIAYYKKSMLKEAISEWQKALKLNPDNIKLVQLLKKAENEVYMKGQTH
ncbi:MAG: tetratricopeptide repeat protein [Ignavibacteriaceae bacterium]